MASPFPSRPPPSHISIMFLNIQSFRTNHLSLHALALHLQVPVILLNETHLRPDQHARLPGYTLHRSDHPRNIGKGGAALAIKPSLTMRTHHPSQPHTFPESITATVYFRSRVLHLSTIYIRNRTPLPLDYLTDLHISFPHFIVLADLNLTQRTLTEMTQFEDHLTRINASLIPLPGPTRPCSGTTPDAVIVHNSLINLVQVSLLPSVGGDHIPILLTIPTNTPRPPTSKPLLIQNFRKADWSSYRTHITNVLTPINPSLSDQVTVNEYTNTLQTTIQSASQAHIPTTKIFPNHPRLPPKYLNLLKLAHTYIHEYQRTHDRYFLTLHRQIIRTIKHYLHAHKRQQWRQTCTQLNALRAHPTRYWRALNQLLGHNTPQVYPITQGNYVPVTTTEKLELFRTHHTMTFNYPINPHFRHDNTVHYEQLQQSPLLQPSSEHTLTPHILNTPITAEEIRNTLHNTKNTAAGPDKIRYKHIQEAPPILFTHLAVLYNHILTSGYYPTSWKESIMLLFPKPGKPSANLDSYRPICLTAILAKILEKILVKRLQPYLKNQNLIPASQCGFLPNLSTNDQLLRLSQTITDNFNLSRPTLLIALDFNKAFDSVWHPALIFKLHYFTLPNSYIRLINSFLTERTSRISINGQLSNPFPTSYGVPQGCPISPLLFLLFVADIPQPPAPLQLLQFADDTAILAPAHSVHTINRKTQPYLQTLVSWCDRWHLSINPTKTQATIFRPRRHGSRVTRNPDQLRLTIRDVPITPQPTLKYLGVTFDQFFTFQTHFLNLKTSFIKRSHLVRRLAGTSWGLNPSLLIHTYKAFIRPTLTYGPTAWAAAADSHPPLLKPLLASERRLVRSAFRLPFRYHSADLYNIFPIEPLDSFIKTLLVRYLHRTLSSQNPIVQSVLESTPNAPRHAPTPSHYLQSLL